MTDWSNHGTTANPFSVTHSVLAATARSVRAETNGLPERFVISRSIEKKLLELTKETDHPWTNSQTLPYQTVYGIPVEVYDKIEEANARCKILREAGVRVQLVWSD